MSKSQITKHHVSEKLMGKFDNSNFHVIRALIPIEELTRAYKAYREKGEMIFEYHKNEKLFYLYGDIWKPAIELFQEGYKEEWKDYGEDYYVFAKGSDGKDVGGLLQTIYKEGDTHIVMPITGDILYELQDDGNGNFFVEYEL